MAAAVCLLHLQLLVSQITMRNLMFLRERLMESFVQEGESLLFLTTVLLRIRQRQGKRYGENGMNFLEDSLFVEI